MRRLAKGVNTPLTSRILGIREIRAWGLDVETREVASIPKNLHLGPQNGPLEVKNC
jgi:hypothetical protein